MVPQVNSATSLRLYVSLLYCGLLWSAATYVLRNTLSLPTNALCNAGCYLPTCVLRNARY